MMTSDNFADRVTKSVVKRASAYFLQEAQIECAGSLHATSKFDLLALGDLTVIIGVGGNVGFLVALSFPRKLVNALYDRIAGGIDVPANEKELYRQEVAAETANVILGHCTADLETCGENISISPPVVLKGERQIQRVNNAMFHKTSLVTNFGNLDISVIGPQKLFDANLNYIKEASNGTLKYHGG